MPHPTTQARHATLHARLLDTAEQTVATQGLQSLRARPLAAAAGCAVGAIYAVVPDLDELILQVNARTLDAIDTALAATPPTPDPATRLAHLAAAYLHYAATHRPRWDALFNHRMATRPAPAWYAARRQAAFLPMAAPLAELHPHLPPDGRETLARTLFAAVHGIVALGLDELLAPTPLPTLHATLTTFVRAAALIPPEPS